MSKTANLGAGESRPAVFDPFNDSNRMDFDPETEGPESAHVFQQILHVCRVRILSDPDPRFKEDSGEREQACVTIAGDIAMWLLEHPRPYVKPPDATGFSWVISQFNIRIRAYKDERWEKNVGRFEQVHSEGGEKCVPGEQYEHDVFSSFRQFARDMEEKATQDRLRPIVKSIRLAPVDAKRRPTLLADLAKVASESEEKQADALHINRETLRNAKKRVKAHNPLTVEELMKIGALRANKPAPVTTSRPVVPYQMSRDFCIICNCSIAPGTKRQKCSTCLNWRRTKSGQLQFIERRLPKKPANVVCIDASAQPGTVPRKAA